MITEAKRNAIKAVLEKVFEGLMDTGTALTIIEGIVEEQQIYVPSYPTYPNVPYAPATPLDPTYQWIPYSTTTTCEQHIYNNEQVKDTKQPLDK